jgi:hypothetical protein
LVPVSWEHPVLNAFFKALPKWRQVQPKNAAIMGDASHGHIHLPVDIWERTMRFHLARLFPADAAARHHSMLGLMRDVTIFMLLWVDARRQGDVFRMTRDVLWDYGAEGFTWVIKHAKTTQTTRVVIPIPARTASGFPAADVLRAFLDIAPQEGLLFRRTRNIGGGRGHEWEPAVRTRSFSLLGETRMGTEWAGYTSGSWNASLRRLIRQACPEFKDVTKLWWSAHSLRSGAVHQAARQGVPQEGLRTMLSHRPDSALAHYTRPSKSELEALYSQAL